MSVAKISQCKDDCCLVSIPSKRFWYVHVVGGKETVTSFGAALAVAAGQDPIGEPT